MANTLSVMTNVLRNVVSKQRIRYKEKGFNLDLACEYNIAYIQKIKTKILIIVNKFNFKMWLII